MLDNATVWVPATSANLGPGFDCLGLALDLWNRTSFSTVQPNRSEKALNRGLLTQVRVQVSGEGSGWLPGDQRNLVVRAAQRLFEMVGAPQPAYLSVQCRNAIPLSSGLGSSSAAVLSGLLGANALLGSVLSQQELLALAAEIEAHPDNVAPALLGGLVIVTQANVEGTSPNRDATQSSRLVVQRLDLPALHAAVVLPEVRLSTRQARAALPARVPLADAVFNLGRTALVIQALQAGDIDLLRSVMHDRLHQPYRLPLIPGAAAALNAAQNAGAAAALSGAGPSLVAFSSHDPAEIISRMRAAFRQAGVKARSFNLTISPSGARVETSKTIDE
jgi:homoserine kinase